MIPLDVDALRAQLARGQASKLRPFWSHRPKPSGALADSCFSQWWPSPFELDGLRYATAEHFMMSGKARLFGDDAIAGRIRASEDPREVKALGRQVAAFSEPAWNAVRFDVVTVGNLAKFTSTPALRAYLLGTAEDVLVEASPDDRIWGIGLSAQDAASGDPARWKGLNLLGFALMRVRGILRGELVAPTLPFSMRPAAGS